MEGFGLIFAGVAVVFLLFFAVIVVTIIRRVKSGKTYRHSSFDSDSDFGDIGGSSFD